MKGAAAGTTTRQRMRAREAPMVAADQSRTRFTARLPACVVTTIGIETLQEDQDHLGQAADAEEIDEIGKSAILGIG